MHFKLGITNYHINNSTSDNKKLINIMYMDII